MIPSERAKYIYKVCRAAGMTYAGAIGMLGNLQGETRDFDPMSCETQYLNRYGLTDAEYTRRADAGEKIHGDYYFTHDSAGYGIAQWTWWGRKKGLLDYARAMGKSVGDLDAQIQYMLHELQTRYTKSWDILKATDSIYAAVHTLVTNYEKPANMTSAVARRCDYAKAWQELVPNSSTDEPEKPVPVTPEIKQYDRQKVINILTAQIGYLEHKNDDNLDNPKANYGTNNHNKFARDLDAIPNFYNGKKCGFPWCDTTVDWGFVAAYGVEAALYLLCQPEKSSGAGCEFSRNYYQRKGQLDTTPEVGAQAFFPQFGTPSHTGLVVEVDGDCVWTIEGNTTGIAEDGKQYEGVFKKMHYRSEIQSYGHPAYNDGYGTADYVGGKTEPEPAPEEPDTPEIEEHAVFDPPTLKNGNKGAAVKKLQHLLLDCGCSVGPDGADGDFGARTASAVRLVQKKLGRPMTGTADAWIWAALIRR